MTQNQTITTYLHRFLGVAAISTVMAMALFAFMPVANAYGNNNNMGGNRNNGGYSPAPSQHQTKITVKTIIIQNLFIIQLRSIIQSLFIISVQKSYSLSSTISNLVRRTSTMNRLLLLTHIHIQTILLAIRQHMYRHRHIRQLLILTTQIVSTLSLTKTTFKTAIAD